MGSDIRVDLEGYQNRSGGESKWMEMRGQSGWRSREIEGYQKRSE